MRMAEVQLVDVGVKRVVPVSDLRVIKDEFLSLPAMVRNSHVAYLVDTVSAAPDCIHRMKVH